MNFLFKLNDKFYNLKAHTVISILWVWSTINFHNLLTIWFKIGIASWVILVILAWKEYNFSKEYFKKIFNRERLKETGILPFLVGLNIAVILGPLSLVLSVVLKKLKRKDQ